MATAFQEARRELHGLTTPLERRVLTWLAARTPAWVHSDHFTALGLLAMLCGGAFYAGSRGEPSLVHAVNACLALNWLGDSMDGTLARHRRRERPRYGFYVDHMVDAIGALFLLGGLAASGLMSERIAIALLLGYYLISIHMYLASHTLGLFQMTYGAFGGTELRLLLVLANLLALSAPRVEVLGRSVLLFDAAGAVGVAGMACALVVAVARNVLALHNLERR